MYTIEELRDDITEYRKKRQSPARYVRALSYDNDIPDIRYDRTLHQIIAKTGRPLSVYALRTVVLEVEPDSITDLDHLQNLCRLAEVHIHLATFRRAACETGARVYAEW